VGKLQRKKKKKQKNKAIEVERTPIAIASSIEVSPQIKKSPKNFEGYPKDYRSNLAWRREILLKAQSDLIYRAKVKELFHRDVIFAFNAFFYTLDVRRRPFHHQPFCTYLYQDDSILKLVASIQEGKDLPIEKSRDMGASWMVILVFFWFWLDPKGGADFLLGSRIEDYVDKKGDMRTLLEKARYALYRLPMWLRPKGFNKKVHDNFMKLSNPESGATITGESNNKNFSTGGRYLAILFDEFAKWEQTDVSAWTAAGDATPSRIPVSTPFGVGGKYYDVVTGGINKIRLHWSLHPIKGAEAYCLWPRADKDIEADDGRPEYWTRSPWYDRECLRRTDDEIAQELDISYLGAGSPVFKGKQARRIQRMINAKKVPYGWREIDLGKMELREIEEPRDEEGILLLWEKLDEDKDYTLGVDVVEGLESGDFAICKILNRNTKSVAASYFSRIDEVQLARVIAILAKCFGANDYSWVGIETNGPGLATFDLCVENYDLNNLFMMPQYDTTRGAISYKKGWRTTTSSRAILVSGIKEWLLEEIGWADPRCCRELQSFIYSKNAKPEAKSGSHDDEVIALGIAFQIDAMAPGRSELPKEEKVDVREQAFNITRIEEAEPSLEERCMLSLLAKKNFDEEVIFYNPESIH